MSTPMDLATAAQRLAASVADWDVGDARFAGCSQIDALTILAMRDALPALAEAVVRQQRVVEAARIMMAVDAASQTLAMAMALRAALAALETL